jgi:poly(ADP-ribose) glycohydrolase
MDTTTRLDPSTVRFVKKLASQLDELFEPDFFDVLQKPFERYKYWRKHTQNDPETYSTTSYRLVLTYKQCACIVANMYLGKLPNIGGFPCRSMARLQNSRSASTVAKLLCVHAYFDTLLKNPFLLEGGHIIIERNQLTGMSKTFPDIPLCPFVWSDGLIEAADEGVSVHVDFANKFLGGGVLRDGSVQEEILCSVRPEMLAALAVNCVMDDNEAVVVVGTRLFAEHEGYGRSFTFTSPVVPPCGGDSTHVTHHSTDYTCAPNVIVAIDAVNVNKIRKTATKHRRAPPTHDLRRDVAKALAGFSSPVIGELGKTVVSTGNWGCGAYGGHPFNACVSQWIAATVAGGLTVSYSHFGNVDALAFKESKDFSKIEKSKISDATLYEHI